MSDHNSSRLREHIGRIFKKGKRGKKNEPGGERIYEQSAEPESTESAAGGPAPIAQGAKNVYSPAEVAAARNELWEKAYKALLEEKRELVLNFESIVKDDANIPQDTSLFSAEAIGKVTASQKRRMENKQWTFKWFDKSVRVRDTVEGIFSMVQDASSMIAAGMEFAPPFVSIPWSFVSMIIPIITNEFSEMHSAIDGLKDVTCILSSYNIAEQEFLANSTTRDGFQDSVLNLYKLIFEYQALAAQLFATRTMKRLGRNILPGTSWEDALTSVRKADNLCRNAMGGLAIQLHQKSFRSLEELIDEKTNLLKRCIDESYAKRIQNGQVVRWISMISALEDHTAIRQQLGDDYLGSGQWLFEQDSDFTTWQQGSSGQLLLQGVVGTGKSSLVSIVLEHLMSHANGRLAFNYCSAGGSSGNTARNNTTNIFRSILAQCSILSDGTIAKPVFEKFQNSNLQGPGECGLGLGATLKLLREVLMLDNDQVTLVFDALDELSDHREFLDRLRTLQIPGKKLRVFFSSRFGIDITSRFPEAVLVPVNSKTEQDIRIYVKTEIQKRWVDSGIDKRQAERLETALVTRAEGVFRWVVLELDIFLRRKGSRYRRPDFERRLSKLENSHIPIIDKLSSAYEQIYQDALGEEDEKSRRRIVIATMKWVLCTFRSFDAGQLASMVSLSLLMAEKILSTDGDSKSNKPLDEQDEFEPVSEEDILLYCANFIIKTQNGMIRLAHLSVRQYFEEKRAEEFSPECQHLEAALTCITALVETLPEVSPFTGDYVSRFWSIHARSAADAPELETLLTSLRFRKHPEVNDLQMKIASKANLEDKDSLGNTILHNAVLWDDRGQVELILSVHALFQRTSPFIKMKNHSGETPLHVSASRGYDDIFKILLQVGSNIHDKNGFGLTPLHVAVLFGQEDIIRATSRSNVELDALDGTDGTALHTAAFCSSVGTSRILINGGANQSQKNEKGQTALDIAQMADEPGVASLLKSTSARTTSDDASNNNAIASQLDVDDEIHNNAKPVPKVRPKISVSALSCQYCDVEEWLEGSRQGLRYPHCPSLQSLEKSSKNCSLCQYFLNAIQDSGITPGPMNDAGVKQLGVSVSVSLVADSRNATASQDLLSIFYGQNLAGQLEFFIDRNVSSANPELSFLTGRAISGYESSLPMIKEWMETCREVHVDCKSRSEDVLPSLLLDIGEKNSKDHLRLLDCRANPPGENRYIFLSWVWGSSPPLLTTRLTLNQFLSGIDENELPPLLRDVIFISRFLGYRYLFVDSLCIIHEGPKLASHALDLVPVYVPRANLVITLTGQGLNRSLFGLDAEQPPEPIVTLRARFDANSTFDLKLRNPVDAPEDVMHDDILTRSQRAQEAILASRLLILDQFQPIWNCGASLKTQGSTIPQAPIFRNTVTLRSQALRGCLATRDLSTEAMERIIYSQWYKYTEMITAEGLNIYGKHLLSAEGVAREVDAIAAAVTNANQRESNSSYYSGVWIGDIHRGLLWIAKGKYNVRHYFEFVNPSWSWASQWAGVSYQLSCSAVGRDNCAKSLLLLKRPSTNGKMLVQGLVRSLSSTEALHMYDLIFDVFDSRKAWASGQTFYLLVVTRLAYTGTGGDHRWVGLILDKSRTDAGAAPYYARVGLFLGPNCGNVLSDWEKQSLVLR